MNDPRTSRIVQWDRFGDPQSIGSPDSGVAVVSCLRCGAAVIITETTQQPAYLHTQWHAYHAGRQMRPEGWKP